MNFLRKHKTIGIIIAVVLVAMAVLLLLEMTGVINLHKTAKDKGYATQPVTDNRTMDQTTKGEGTNQDGMTTTTTSNGEVVEYGDDKVPTNIASTAKTLRNPEGPFLSNNKPNLSGTPRPNSIQSVCNTTPGAYCELIFTKDQGGDVKSLPKQLTDRAGAAYWTWKLQDIGITEGVWTVTAKATLDNQEKTITDSIKLEVAK